MAPYLLHFEIMRTAKGLGYQTYDLFGVPPQGGSNDGWTDISVFKRKFGGRELRLVPSLEYIYDSTAYQEWKASEEE
jgi:lipid II:glycine glycyltransferase (peptidoglycan interpeptide bridge formation enzyme)